MMNKETYKALRARLFDVLPENMVVFLMSGDAIRKSADSTYPFEANRNFYYLTGINEPEAVLVLDTTDRTSRVFLREVDETMEKWVGHYMRTEEALEVSGVDYAQYFDEFETFMERTQARKNIQLGIDADHDQYSDNAIGSGVMFATYLGEETVTNVFSYLTRVREVKHPDEIAAIKHAAQVTNDAILASLDHMKPGNSEKEIAARFLYEGMRQDGDLMFDTIVASGKNAVVLHYIENNDVMADDELVLLDLGIRVNGYGADISRTFPVNGTFNARQKDVYTVVLDAFHAVNQAIRPGVSIMELNDLAKEILAQGCKKLGLIENTEDVSQYYYHSIGHSLGLDTHDVWSDRKAPLQAGNVITNEPGLYIAEEGIGIRIETDVLVTETGYEDLAPQIIREIDDIESYLSTRKLSY